MFENLRVNGKKIEKRVREFINSLRPPHFFLKTNDLFNFLSSLPVRWKSHAQLIVFARSFDIAKLGYFPSSAFTKSYTAYVEIEAPIKNQFNAVLIVLRDILRINRVTLSEFEQTLNTKTEFGYTRKEGFEQLMMTQKLAGIDTEIIADIFHFLQPG